MFVISRVYKLFALCSRMSHHPSNRSFRPLTAWMSNEHSATANMKYKLEPTRIEINGYHLHMNYSYYRWTIFFFIGNEILFMYCWRIRTLLWNSSLDSRSRIFQQYIFNISRGKHLCWNENLYFSGAEREINLVRLLIEHNFPKEE